MRLTFAFFLVVHGLIHLMGFAKALRLADLPQLTQPITPFLGVLWLVGAVLFLVTAGSIFIWPRWWWALGAVAVLVSLAVIVPSWADAKFGVLANLLLSIGILFGFLIQGPYSLRTEYDHDVTRALARRAPGGLVVTESTLVPLPTPVQRFLRASGVVGQARVWNVRARMHGRIRSSPGGRWMPFTAEQYNFYDEPSRFFYMNASMLQVPIQGYHRYVGTSATMRVKAAGLVTVAEASGPEMTRAETVTMLNDMCLLAPAALVDPAIVWDAVDARTARATFTHAGQTIRAELSFNETGALVDFRSDDRLQTSPDGQTLRPMPWSTPLGGSRTFGAIRLAARGEARWHEPAGDYAYIQIALDDVQYNVGRR
jgi:Family of unknown function (DUF6544)